MSNSLSDALLPIALVGTERSPGWRAALRNAPVPLTALMQGLSEAPDGAAAVTVLRAAGALAVAERVGRPLAARQTLPAPGSVAGTDARPPLSSAHGQALLQRLLSGDTPLGLRHEALHTLQRLGWRLPAALLPAMLDLAVSEAGLRPAIASVMGERGRWLVPQVRRWAPVVEVPAEPTLVDWEHGQGAARLAWLQAERRLDPAAARERFTTEMPQLAARERTELLGALAIGLSADDEPLLTRLLRDRAADVRALAATLLQRLPDSEQVRWLHGQWDALLRQDSAWLGLRQRWVLDAPTAEDPDWKARSLVPQRPPHSRLGDRAWWLAELARLTPLAMWTTRLDLPPAEVIAWARTTEWFDALLQGWQTAALAAPGVLGASDALPGAIDPAWAAALLACPEAGRWSESDRATLRSRLPAAPRRADWLQRLRASRARQGDAADVAREVVHLAEQTCRLGGDPAALFDAELSQALADALVRDLKDLDMAEPYGSVSWRHWSSVIDALAGWLPASSWPVLQGWAPPAVESQDRHWQQEQLHAAHDRLRQWLDLRRAWQALPAALPPPDSLPHSSARA